MLSLSDKKENNNCIKYMEENKIFEKYKTFVMVGKSGCGKGKQAHFLAEKSGFVIFSTGDKFRELKKADTVLGRKVADTIDNGKFMPPWFASFLFEEAVLHLPEGEGIIFEGAGRKLPEAELFHDVMEWLERPYLAIELEISDEEVMKRLLKRKEIEGRADDTEEGITSRLEEYKKYVVPVVDFFEKKGTLLRINGEQTPEATHEEIMRKLAEK
jgi:adenylate kinase